MVKYIASVHVYVGRITVHTSFLSICVLSGCMYAGLNHVLIGSWLLAKVAAR